MSWNICNSSLTREQTVCKHRWIDCFCWILFWCKCQWRSFVSTLLTAATGLPTKWKASEMSDSEMQLRCHNTPPTPTPTPCPVNRKWSVRWVELGLSSRIKLIISLWASYIYTVLFGSLTRMDQVGSHQDISSILGMTKPQDRMQTANTLSPVHNLQEQGDLFSLLGL